MSKNYVDFVEEKKLKILGLFTCFKSRLCLLLAVLCCHANGCFLFETQTSIQQNSILGNSSKDQIKPEYIKNFDEYRKFLDMSINELKKNNPPNHLASSSYLLSAIFALNKISDLSSGFKKDLESTVNELTTFRVDLNNNKITPATADSLKQIDDRICSSFHPEKIWPSSSGTTNNGSSSVPDVQIEAWLAYSAFENLYRDFRSKWMKGEDCDIAYVRTLKTLYLLQNLLKDDIKKQKYVKSAVEILEATSEYTKKFKEVPKASSRDKIIQQLDTAATVIFTICNPDK